MVEQHHVVLDHAEPLGLLLRALERAALLDVGACAVETGLFIVPQGEPDRAIGADVSAAEDAGQLHDERRARAVVICRLAQPIPSMWPPTMYISSGCVVPILVQ